jgi:hypothetical protein
MAILGAGKRRGIWSDLMSEWSRARKPINSTKDVIFDAVNSVDQWFSDQTPSLISALPKEFRDTADADQIQDLVDKVYNTRKLEKAR